MLKLSFLVGIFLLSQVNSQETCKSKFGTPLEGSCSIIDECTGAALQGDCPNPNHACCIADLTRTVPDSVLFKKNTFLKLAGNTTRNNAIYRYFVESMSTALINSEYRLAAYFSQLAGETNNFAHLESLDKELDVNPNIGNTLPGDGLLYRGRGAIHLRGKTNYELASKIPSLNNLLLIHI